jgi:sugar phosphate isomerase/epimerase
MDTDKKKISLGSWAFTYGPYEANPISFEATARRLAQAGYDGIEIGGFEPHITLARYPDSASRKQVRRFLDDLGLGVSSYAADFGTIDPIRESNRQAYLDLFSRFIEVCLDLGAPSIRVDCVLSPGTLPYLDQRSAVQQLADTWREAAARAELSRVTVVWEFEPAFVFNRPSEVIDVVERVGHPNFRILFDTSHAYMCSVVGARQIGIRETLPGGVSEFLERVEDHIGHIHLIDSDGTLYQEDTSTHAPFGQGEIDFRSLAPGLRAVPGVDWWCIDLCFWPGAWDLVEPSLQFVQSLLLNG